MSADTKDQNDRLQAGNLPEDARNGARPMNNAAKAKESTEMRVLSVRDLLRQSMEDAFSKEPVVSCTSGHSAIDRHTGGMRKGLAWLVIAETSWGKSSLAIAMADENIKKGKRCLIVSTEDAESVYGDRLMARRSRCSASRLRDRKLQPEECNAVTNVANAAEDIPVFLDARGRNIEVIIPQITELIEREGIDMVLVDYLQEIRTAKRYQDERVKTKDVASMIRCVIKDHNITGATFSQLTPKDGKKYPDKYSVKESKDAADGADVILVGFTLQEEAVLPQSGLSIPAGEKCIKVDKVKNGTLGKVWANWNKHSACFDAVNYGDQWDPWDCDADREAAERGNEIWLPGPRSARRGRLG